jgi:prevent-host-death family protein
MAEQMPIWSIPDAKSKLSELLRRARRGESQIIGAQEPCVVLSMADFNELQRKAGAVHLGRWLVDNTPRGLVFDAPERSGGRGNPFEAD